VPERRGGGDGLIDALPGLARIYAAAWWHTAEWTVSSSLHAASRLARSAARGEAPAELAGVAADELRDYARRMREIVDADRAPGGLAGEASRRCPEEASISSLRSRGEELLRLSADIDYEEETHPAYGRILSQLAPDEARILRLLALRGPQPAIDVRSGLPLASSLVAPGRNMIGAEAGCRYPDRVPAYLNNLYRLGLIWFSREPLSDRLRYQVLEAQPDVLEAMKKGGRTARTVRRSIVLTPFGRDFCEVVLPAGEPGAAPEDGA
jgi:Abortive infection alpha